MSMSLIEAVIQEPGALGDLARLTLHRPTGEDGRDRHRDLLPLPLPRGLGALVQDRRSRSGVAGTTCGHRRSRLHRALGIDVWFFLVIV